MPTLTTGLYQLEQNISNPGIGNLVLSYRVILPTANTTTTINLPNNWFNPAQVSPTSAPSNYAPQANPVLPSNQPQQGRRLFVTQLLVRDANGTLSGSGATTPASIALVDVTQANAVVASLSPAAGTTAPYYFSLISAGAVVVNPYDALAVTFTAQTAGTAATATGMSLDVFGFWQQGI